MLVRGFAVVLFTFLLPGMAHAYVGPGAGLGVVTVTLAFVLGVFLLLVGFVWYPLKRIVRRLKSANFENSSAKEQ
jgi:membrane protein implicated in regulation of membrane protease activity